MAIATLEQLARSTKVTRRGRLACTAQHWQQKIAFDLDLLWIWRSNERRQARLWTARTAPQLDKAMFSKWRTALPQLGQLWHHKLAAIERNRNNGGTSRQLFQGCLLMSAATVCSANEKMLVMARELQCHPRDGTTSRDTLDGSSP